MIDKQFSIGRVVDRPDLFSDVVLGGRMKPLIPMGDYILDRFWRRLIQYTHGMRLAPILYLPKNKPTGQVLASICPVGGISGVL